MKKSAYNGNTDDQHDDKRQQNRAKHDKRWESQPRQRPTKQNKKDTPRQIKHTAMGLFHP